MYEALIQAVVMYLFFITIVTCIYWLIKKKFSNKLFAIIYILILISPFFSYISVEINTYLYGKEFKDVKIDSVYNRSVIYYKVFSINDRKAKLFYVEGENGSRDVGNIYDFVKEDGKWKFKKWESTIWTNLGGSASEFTVPPYF